MAETDDIRPVYSEVGRRAECGGVSPAKAPFPLTPLEAWFVVQGWAVKPAGGISIDQVRAMPGTIEGSNDWLWRV